MASIERRGKRSFRLVVEAGYDASGKRIKRTRTIRIEDEGLLRTPKKLKEYLLGELMKFKAEVEAGEYVAPDRMTFETFVRNEWLPKYAQKYMSPLTVRNYVDHLERTIIPAFGHRKLHEIKPLHIVTFMDNLDKSDLSCNTKLYIFKVMKSVFNQAMKWKVLQKNPMEDISPPKAQKKKPQYYDETNAQRVINALMQEPLKWRLFFLGALLGGFRRGELIALEWTDVDFDRGILHVRKSISLTQNGQAVEKNQKPITRNDPYICRHGTWTSYAGTVFYGWKNACSWETNGKAEIGNTFFMGAMAVRCTSTHRR